MLIQVHTVPYLHLERQQRRFISQYYIYMYVRMFLEKESGFQLKGGKVCNIAELPPGEGL